MPNRGLVLGVCLGLSCAGAAWSQQYTIAPVAGNGSAGFVDGSDPTAAQFNKPNAIAIDSKGGLYVADTPNNPIPSISGTTVATVAGTRTVGAAGEPRAPTPAPPSR